MWVRNAPRQGCLATDSGPETWLFPQVAAAPALEVGETVRETE